MTTSVTAANYAIKTEPHRSFPITDFKEGLFLAREPWMSPANAFRRVENARAFRGQIVKRGGFSRFAELTGDASDTRIINTAVYPDSTSADLNHTGRLTEFKMALDAERPIPESVRFDDNSGVAGATIYARLTAESWFDEGGFKGWRYEVVAEGTSTLIGYAAYYTNQTEVFVAYVFWDLHPDFDAVSADEGYISYRLPAGTEIVGLFNFRNGTNEYVLACDPDYVYRYDLTAKYYKRQGFDGSFAGPFTGGSQDYFWFWQVDDYVVMTNNVDPVCKWDPNLSAADSVVEMDTDWSTPGTNALDTALIVVSFAGRLVYLNTVESTTRYPTRARWTEAGSATTWRSPFDFSDAPRDKGEIVTAEFIGERLFVGFEKGWMELVRRPGDDIQAFEWRPVISRFGAVSKLSTIQDSERLLSRSATSMQLVDPNGQTYLDVQIPDLVLDFSTKYSERCATIRSELDRSFWWTYVSQEATKPSNILCAVYDEENRLSWSQYDLAFNVFSVFEQDGVTTWNALGPRTLNSYAGQTANSLGAGSEGRAQVIGGQSSGFVYRFDGSTRDGYYDEQTRITMTLDTQKLMPFPGQRAHFGWLDLFVDLSQSAQVRIFFYADESNTPYLNKTVTLAPVAASGKAYKRITVGRTALLHRFKIETLDDQPLAFDAFVPWFRPAGRVRQF